MKGHPGFTVLVERRIFQLPGTLLASSVNHVIASELGVCILGPLRVTGTKYDPTSKVNAARKSEKL